MHGERALKSTAGRTESPPGSRRGRYLDESLPVMVWIARPDMSCEYLSRAWLEFTGSTAEQALGDGWSRGVHPEDLARWLDTCVRAFDAREPFEIEYRLRRRDGEYRWVLDRGVPRHSADGLFLGYAGSCVDIDAQKRACHELARALERERRQRTAAEQASRQKDGFFASVLHDLQSPVQAIATWAHHLREQALRSSEASEALEAIERNARAQDRILSELLDLSRLAAGGAPEPRAPANEPILSGVRILLADDDAAAREAMARVLEVAGAQVRCASTCGTALELVEDFRPDVLVSGLNAPRGEGSLIGALRARPAERGGCVRAAALTPIDRPEAGPQALAAGFDAQIARPAEPVALLAAVARLAHPGL